MSTARAAGGGGGGGGGAQSSSVAVSSPLGVAYFAGAMAEAKGIARLVQKQAGRAKEKVQTRAFNIHI